LRGATRYSPFDPLKRPTPQAPTFAPPRSCFWWRSPNSVPWRPPLLNTKHDSTAPKHEVIDGSPSRSRRPPTLLSKTHLAGPEGPPSLPLFYLSSFEISCDMIAPLFFAQLFPGVFFEKKNRFLLGGMKSFFFRNHALAAPGGPPASPLLRGGAGFPAPNVPFRLCNAAPDIWPIELPCAWFLPPDAKAQNSGPPNTQTGDAERARNLQRASLWSRYSQKAPTGFDPQITSTGPLGPPKPGIPAERPCARHAQPRPSSPDRHRPTYLCRLWKTNITRVWSFPVRPLQSFHPRLCSQQTTQPI